MSEGSRKVLGGQEVFTRRNYTTERGNIFETMDGQYILANGELVKDRSHLEILPEQHRQKALDWWDVTFGGVKPKPAAPSTDELLAKIKKLEADNTALEAKKESSKATK